MSDTRWEPVWRVFREKAIREHGARRFQTVTGKYKLRETFDSLTKQRDTPADRVDVEDAADDFLALTRHYFESPKQEFQNAQEGAVPYMLTSGSMQSVSAYAEALPIILRARQDVLGQKEPLNLQEAKRWLVLESGEPANQTLVEVRFRFLVPNTFELLGRSIEGAMGQSAQLLSFLEHAAIPARIAPGTKRPSITHMQRRVSFEHDGDNHTLDLLQSRSERVHALVSWASRLADRCVGAMASRAGDQPRGFEWAVWLILAGVWPRIATYGVLSSNRDRAGGLGGLAYRRQSPYVELNVLALDMPPEEVADSYRRLCAGTNLTRRGPKMEAESEILCLAALEAKDIDGLGWEDGARFREAVLRRYSAKATLHGLDPTRFTATANSWSRARKTLRRAETVYAKLYPPASPPVKTPRGPRTLVATEPGLFSRSSESGSRLA